MNILFVTTDDILRNSSSNIRNVSLLYGLSKNGHKITILNLCHGHQIDQGLYSVLSDCKLIYLNKEYRRTSSDVKRNSLTISLKKIFLSIYNKFRIFDPYIHYKPLRLEELNIGPVDILLSSSDPRSSHVLAKKIKNALNKEVKWVQYWGDPMAYDISAAKMMKPILKRIEKKLLCDADVVLYTNSITAKFVKETYKLNNNIVTHIPTSFPFAGINTTEASGNSPDCIRLGYFVGYKKKLRNMQHLFESVQDIHGCCLTLVGNTDCVVPNNDKFRKYSRMSSDKLKEIQSMMDILVVVENLSVSKQVCVQIPGKMFHYGLTNQKVLVITENGILKKEFECYNRYKFCENNKESIIKAIMELINDETPSMNSIVSDFLPTTIAHKFEEIVHA